MAMTLSVTMAAFWVVVAWLFGRIYCSSACPLGTWLDIIGWLGRKSRKGTLRDYHYSPPLNRWRYTSLLVILVCFIGEITVSPGPCRSIQHLRAGSSRAAQTTMGPCLQYHGNHRRPHRMVEHPACKNHNRRHFLHGSFGSDAIVGKHSGVVLRAHLLQCHMPHRNRARHVQPAVAVAHRHRHRPMHQLPQMRACMQSLMHRSERPCRRRLTVCQLF